MTVAITGRHVDVTPELKSYTEKKVRQLTRHFPRVVSANVVLASDRRYHVAEITLQATGLTAHATDRSHDLETAIDLVTGKLERQLRRYKERLRDHRARRGQETVRGVSLTVNVLEGTELERHPSRPRVIRTDQYAIKPMDLDEALMQMDLIHQDFLVFRNAQSRSVNVLYRRSDGHYGLVETEL